MSDSPARRASATKEYPPGRSHDLPSRRATSNLEVEQQSQFEPRVTVSKMVSVEEEMLDSESEHDTASIVERIKKLGDPKLVSQTIKRMNKKMQESSDFYKAKFKSDQLKAYIENQERIKRTLKGVNHPRFRKN